MREGTASRSYPRKSDKSTTLARVQKTTRERALEEDARAGGTAHRKGIREGTLTSDSAEVMETRERLGGFEQLGVKHMGKKKAVYLARRSRGWGGITAISCPGFEMKSIKQELGEPSTSLTQKNEPA